MQDTTAFSTLLLTLLLLVGLFFFLRASVKDRTEEAEIKFSTRSSQVAENLRTHLERRSYQLVEEGDRLVFSGIVAPSRFLATFLTLLAFLGLICLSLVLATLFPDFGGLFTVLPLLCPLIGIFYWRRARRPEQVVAKIMDMDNGTRLVIRAHRDEILVLKDALASNGRSG